jgi:hypothetical protein
LAKPGLSGRSSNSSEHTTQTLIGKAISFHFKGKIFAEKEAEAQKVFGPHKEMRSPVPERQSRLSGIGFSLAQLKKRPGGQSSRTPAILPAKGANFGFS